MYCTVNTVRSTVMYKLRRECSMYNEAEFKGVVFDNKRVRIYVNPLELDG